MADPAPVVVLGCGLSGMAISRALSRGGIEHVLVGRAPRAVPRAGESLDLVATVLLRRLFPELEQLLLPKKSVTTVLAHHSFVCPLEVTRRGPAHWLLPALGFSTPECLDHVDRAAFDTAMFEQVASSPHCRHTDAWVADGVAHDAGSGRIERMVLSDGLALAPRFVFDASGMARVVGRQLGGAFRKLGPRQRTLMCRLPLDGPPSPNEQWRYGTALLRLYRDTDGVDASTWCIPVGDAVSIGVTRALDAPALDDGDLLERALRGWRRLGRALPEPTGPAPAFEHEHGHLPRAWGPNWLLCGPAHGAVWWSSTTGIGQGLAAAAGAVEAVHDPARVGMILETYMADMIASHRRLDGFMHPAPPPGCAKDFARRATPLVRGNLLRLALCTQLVGASRAQGLAAQMVRELVGRRGLGPVRCRVVPTQRSHA